MGLFDRVKKQLGNVTETAKKAAENLPDSVKEIDTEKALKGFRSIGGEAFQKIKNDSADLYDKAKESLQKKEPTIYIREEDALKIMYYLMASDMSIDDEEIEMFDSIGHDLDPNYDTYRDAIINSCQAKIAGISDSEEFYDIVHEQVNSAIHDSQNSTEGNVVPRVLLWNLITIAFAENDYSTNERRLIRSVARTLEIDAAVLKEMEGAIRTMMALTEEERILRSSERKYAEVEPYMNEVADRRQTIRMNVHALMLD